MRKPTSKPSLAGGNTRALDSALGIKDGLQIYAPLLRLLAEMLDQIAEGEDVYVTIGSTKRKDTFLLTLTWDHETTYMPADSLASMAAGAGSFL